MKTYNEYLFEESNLIKDKTGLPVVIYISLGLGVPHGPRIKCNKNYSNRSSNNRFSVTIEDEPKIIGDVGEIKQQDINKIISFVKKNRIILLQHWNDEIDSFETIKQIKEHNLI